MESRTPTTSINGGAHHDYDDLSYQDTGVYDCEGNILPDLLDSQIDSTLQSLDMGAIKKNSYDRTRAAMAVRDRFIDGILNLSYILIHEAWLTRSCEFSLGLLVLFIYQFSRFCARKQLWVNVMMRFAVLLKVVVRSVLLYTISR